MCVVVIRLALRCFYVGCNRQSDGLRVMEFEISAILEKNLYNKGSRINQSSHNDVANERIVRLHEFARFTVYGKLSFKNEGNSRLLAMYLTPESPPVLSFV